MDMDQAENNHSLMRPSRRGQMSHGKNPTTVSLLITTRMRSPECDATIYNAIENMTSQQNVLPQWEVVTLHIIKVTVSEPGTGGSYLRYIFLLGKHHHTATSQNKFLPAGSSHFSERLKDVDL